MYLVNLFSQGAIQPQIVVAKPYPTNTSMGSSVIVRNSPRTGSRFFPKMFTTINRKQWDWSKIPGEQVCAHKVHTKRSGKAVFVTQEDFSTLDRGVGIEMTEIY